MNRRTMPKTKFDVPWWATIVLSVIIVCVGITIGILLKRLNITNVLMAIALVVLAAITGALVARLTASQQIINAEENIREEFNNLSMLANKCHAESDKIITQSKFCQDCSDSLNRSIDKLKNIMEGKFSESLVTYDDLKRIEASVREKSQIWVLTSALVLERTELPEIIRNNFRNKVIYKYMIPREDKILQNQFVNLAQEWQQDCNLSMEATQQQIQCYLVPKSFAHMTVVIYNPYDKPIVLVKFPASEFYKKERYPFIYRISMKPDEETAVNIFVDSLQRMMEDDKLATKLSIPLFLASEKIEGGKR